MKNKMQFVRNSFAVLMLIVLFGSVAARAQDRERYVISAKAGGVNMVLGTVMLKHRGNGEWQQLRATDDLNSGDTVRAGADGRVEVLLNPGSYLRIAENSAFELTDPSLDSLRLKILEGSALIEVTGADETTTLMEVKTQQSRIMIDRRGLYRVNVTSANATELLVRKGRASISNDSAMATTVKDGKMATVSGSQLAVAKFDKSDQDAFAVWSKVRSDALVAANSRLSQGTIARNYSRYGYGPYGYGRGRNGYGSFGGLWVFDPFIGYHTFFPFYSGWYSPYGHHYRHGFGISAYRHVGGGFLFGGRYGSGGFSRHVVGRTSGRSAGHRR